MMKKRSRWIKLAVLSVCGVFCLLVCTGTLSVEAESSGHCQKSSSISGSMSFEESAAYYAEEYDVPYPAAYESLGGEEMEDLICSTGNTIRILSVSFPVEEDEQDPSIEFFCNTSEGTSSWGIQSIYAVHLNCMQEERKFGGTIEAWLRTPYSIEYIVDGEWYEDGRQKREYKDTSDRQYPSGIEVLTINEAQKFYAYSYTADTWYFQK